MKYEALIALLSDAKYISIQSQGKVKMIKTSTILETLRLSRRWGSNPFKAVSIKELAKEIEETLDMNLKEINK